MPTTTKTDRLDISGLDPTSADVFLRYTGTDEGVPSIASVPARDLSGHDLAKLVYARSRAQRQAEGLEGLVPGDAGFTRALRDLIEELTATDLYDAPRHAPRATED